MALAVIALLVLALVVPPLISVSHYKGQITHLIAQSLGRPVRLSSVEVRLLPWPGFVLYRPERCRRSRLRRRTGAACQQGDGFAAPAGFVAREARNRQDQRRRGQPEPGARRTRAMEPRSHLPHCRRADRRAISDWREPVAEAARLKRAGRRRLAPRPAAAFA